MSRTFWPPVAFLLALGLATNVAAQSAAPPSAPQLWTWENVKDRFHLNNTTLLAGKLNIDELKAEEITAHLRPNPDFTLSADGTQITPSNGTWRPFAGTFVSPGISYLFERRNKRGLRFESAQQGTAIGVAQQSDSERNLLFNLRSAFVGILQAKAVLRLAQDNLDYYDKILKVSRDRFQAGDIAHIDLDRLELQRLQYESDLQTARVNLRTTKINLLALLDDRRPVDSFDVDGPFDFSEELLSLDNYRKDALDARPDLRAAVLQVKQAETNYQLAEANGSADPTIGLWFTHNGSFNNPDALNTLGASVSIPLRVFDRNQGEKLRANIDVKRDEKLHQGVETQVYSDVDSAYAVLNSNLNLLKPYKQKYLAQAVSVRDTILFSYQHGGASLLDFLNAESEYRTVELSYANLIGSYLTAAAQMNLAVGREVIP
ncbi:MAG TPA: TolC family protein [Candidatus Sulfotelmatobacter sp.]|jgi:cobalt-zinc-cadmium efflux system outer membrane protein|nr:TolC family protein [Candidatus Sulfotelmatobacter sp.]